MERHLQGWRKGQGKETICPWTRVQPLKLMNLNPWPIMCYLLSFNLVMSGGYNGWKSRSFFPPVLRQFECEDWNWMNRKLLHCFMHTHEWEYSKLNLLINIKKLPSIFFGKGSLFLSKAHLCEWPFLLFYNVENIMYITHAYTHI